MNSTIEDVVAALSAQLVASLATALPGVDFRDEELDGDVAEIPDAGLVGVFLDDRGLPEEVNGDGPFFRTAAVRVEIMVKGRSGSERRTRMRAVIDAIEAAIDLDRSFGGAAIDCDREAQDPEYVETPGAADLASEVILVLIDFQSNSRL